MSQSLCEQLLGKDFALLPSALQRFHALEGHHVLGGWVEIDAPVSVSARILALCLGTPVRAERGPIRFELDASPSREVWTRHFPSKVMRSCMTLATGCLVERLGLARLSFSVHGSPKMLELKLARLHFLGVPCPRRLLPAIVAEETAMDGRLHFCVRATVPVIGVVASYRGHLEVPTGRVR